MKHYQNFCPVAGAGEWPVLDPPQEGPDQGKCTQRGLYEQCCSGLSAASPRGKKKNLSGWVWEHYAVQHTEGSCQEAWKSPRSAALVLQGSSGGGNLPGRGQRNQAAGETLGGGGNSPSRVLDRWCFPKVPRGAPGKRVGATHLAQGGKAQEV